MYQQHIMEPINNYKSHNEYDFISHLCLKVEQLACIMEIFGVPPMKILEGAPRIKMCHRRNVFSLWQNGMIC